MFFYGENIDRYMKIAHDIPTPAPGPAPVIAAAAVPAGAAAPVAPQAVAGRSVVAIAKAEFDRFHGINEGNQPLRGRIADYYQAAGGSRDLDPTLDENAWSAAFVSFCVKQSGATADQFKFSMLHSVYVKAAIANADAGRGVHPSPATSFTTIAAAARSPSSLRVSMTATPPTARSWSISRSATAYVTPSLSAATSSSPAAPARSARNPSRSTPTAS
jgi:hypothetical protein